MLNVAASSPTLPDDSTGDFERARATSIGLDADPVLASPRQSPDLSMRASPADALLASKLSYYRSLSRNLEPQDQQLLDPPRWVYDPLAPTAVMLKGIDKDSGRAGSAGLIFSLWNTMMGSTLLVMPYAFYEAGWLLGTILCIICAVASYITCSYVLRHGEAIMMNPAAEFADFAAEHLGRAGWYSTFIASLFVLMGAATAMHGYMAMSLQQLVAEQSDDGGLHLISNWPTVGDGNWVPPIVLLAIVLPLANLPSVAALAKLSTIGVFCFIFLLVFSYISAIHAGFDMGGRGANDTSIFDTERMFKPGSAGAVFGIFSLAFFVHNCVLTIMRAAAYPKKNQRNLKVAYTLVWFCYASMGLLANLCPPMGDAGALETLGKNSFLSVPQDESMAGLLLASRLAVLIQSITVYPILLYIVRAQVFSAFIFKRAYPGPLPVFVLSVVLACITSILTLKVHISDVLRFAGAFGCLICVYSVPSLVHRKESIRLGELTWCRTVTIALLIAFGLFCACIQVF